MGNFLKGKVIPIGDKTIKGIQRDPIDIMGWYEEEALVAWKNIFPLTEVSARLGYLLVEDKAWLKTPNPYWHFLMDKPMFPPLTNMVSVQQGSPLWKHLCKESMNALEKLYLVPAICCDGSHGQPISCETFAVFNAYDSMHSKHTQQLVSIWDFETRGESVSRTHQGKDGTETNMDIEGDRGGTIPSMV